MSTRTPDQGLLFVYAECGPDVSETEFNDWYDNEHVPARLTVPGFSAAARYMTTDSQSPTWLALYDVASPDILYTDAYKGLRTTASINEHSIVSRLATLNRRVYSHISTLVRPSTDTVSVSDKFVTIVGIQISLEAEADFNRWYEEEHMPLFSKLPSWLCGRRYKLVDHTELAGKADTGNSAKGPSQYLTLHYWDREPPEDTAEYKQILSTEWSLKVMKSITDIEVRLFAMYKRFQKPELFGAISSQNL